MNPRNPPAARRGPTVVARRIATQVLLFGLATPLCANPQQDAATEPPVYAARRQRNVVPPAELASEPAVPPPPPTSAALPDPARDAAAVRAGRDVDGAVRLGWSAFNAGRLDEAADWFRSARAWDPAADVPDAALGLAFIAQRQGHLGEAAALVRPHAGPGSPARTLLADILAAQSAKARDSQRYAETAALLAELETQRPLRREERFTRAWNRVDLGEFDAAARDFEALYREQPDAPAAEGVLVATEKSVPPGPDGRDTARARLDALSREAPGGPLTSLVTRRLPPLPRASGQRAVVASNTAKPAVTIPPQRFVDAAGALSTRAARDAEAGRYAESLAALNRLEKEHRPPNRGERLLRAWDRFHLNDFRMAGDEFARLYQEQPDESAAQGLFYSRQRLGRTGELAALDRAQPGGPLGPLVAGARAQDFFDRGLYLGARAGLPPGSLALPQLRHVDTPFLTVGGVFREKSGGEGTSRLSARTLPFVDVAFVGRGLDEVRISVVRQDLDSGKPPADAALGSAPLDPARPRRAPTSRADNLVIPTISWRREGETTVSAQLGTTPLNGPVFPLPTGRVGVRRQMPWGELRGDVFAGSVTESILSTVGVRDPYSDRTFGRVVETGGQAGFLAPLGGGWSVSGDGSAAALVGENVADNYDVRGSVGLGRNFRLPGFHYFSLGPGLIVEHFGRNENHFTVGHGGYFSPAYLVQPMAGLNFQTESGRRFVIDGGLTIGGQTNHQDSAPFFPLGELPAATVADDGRRRRYAGTTNSSLVLSARLDSVWRLADHWQLGADIEYRKSADYDDLVGLFFVRYLLDPRPAVVASDLVKPVF